jgi:hypothetical protein
MASEPKKRFLWWVTMDPASLWHVAVTTGRPALCGAAPRPGGWAYAKAVADNDHPAAEDRCGLCMQRDKL